MALACAGLLQNGAAPQMGDSPVRSAQCQRLPTGPPNPLVRDLGVEPIPEVFRGTGNRAVNGASGRVQKGFMSPNVRLTQADLPNRGAVGESRARLGGVRSLTTRSKDATNGSPVKFHVFNT